MPFFRISSLYTNVANFFLHPKRSRARFFLRHQVLTVQPGPGSMYQDVSVLHRPSRTLLVCDVLLSVTAQPPAILTQVPEYTRALLFHARAIKDDDVVPDTPANRAKGWRRIVLLCNFFFPCSGAADLGMPHYV